MHIAVLGIKTLPASAGADRVVEKLLENFGPEHSYTVYLRADARVTLSCTERVRYVYVPALGGKHLAPFSYFALCTLHYLSKGRYDLAHVHNSDFGIFCALLRLKRGVPVMGTFHGDPYLRRKWGRLARMFLRLSERFFTQFSNGLSSVSRLKTSAVGLVGGRRVRYLPNGVDAYWNAPIPSTFDPSTLGVERGRYTLFACGRLDSTKGLHRLIEAYRRVDRTEKLLAIGDFTHDVAYSERVRALAAEDDRVVLLERLLDREQLMQVVRGCRVFVFPSEIEAMSMMLLEAISCKRPVVCSDIPENLTVVGEDYPLAYGTYDTADLAKRLESALSEPDQSGAERLFDACMRRFSWPRIAADYEAAFAELRPDRVSPARAVADPSTAEAKAA